MVAEHGKSLRIESKLLATGEIATLTQPFGEPLQWQIKRGNETLDVEVSGKTLLHVVGQDESGFEIHLESLFTRMLRGRSVREIASQDTTIPLRKRHHVAECFSARIGVNH